MKTKLNRTISIAMLTIILVSTIIFSVRGNPGTPPSASFAYWPAAPYQNMTVLFDASSSTPEGFNDIITRFEWNFGDGTPKVVKTGAPPDPTVTHAFPLGTFTITLNVTDSEGLWSTTMKPITTLPEFGPTANFTWTPPSPVFNQTATFNASNSTTGWSARTASFSPIQSYKWNFADGTGDIIVTNPITSHTFTQPANYTVTLTVIDADGRSALTSAVVPVQNVTLKIYDAPTGDGKIDIRDIYAVGRAFGSQPGYPNWNPVCDFNKDNKVDMKDYFPVCQNYGKDP